MTKPTPISDVNPKFASFVKNFTYWATENELINSPSLIAIRYKKSENGTETCEMEWKDEEGEEVYIGNFADPGLEFTWIGEHDIMGTKKELVKVNGIVMEANGKAVTAWAIGYDMM